MAAIPAAMVRRLILYGLVENLIRSRSSMRGEDAAAKPSLAPAMERDLLKVCTTSKLS